MDGKAGLYPMVAGSCAGFWYWTAFYPADTVKSLIQSDSRFSGASIGSVFKHVVKEEGVKGLYRGW